MRTHAVPTERERERQQRRARSRSARRPATTVRGSRLSACGALMRVADPLAEQAGRPENEHEDQHEESEDVLVVAETSAPPIRAIAEPHWQVRESPM